VIADSEALANSVLAEWVTALGLPTTPDQALDRYMGKRWAEAIAAIEEGVGRPVPACFADDLKSATLARFRTDLCEVSGTTKFLEAFAAVPRCIASSSSAERLASCLDILGLADMFGPHVYSADLVPHGKPHPDIYLLAAERLNMTPSACVVIEDSPGGVRAGRAAGMAVIGLCAASHIRAGHGDRLREAGAHHIAASWADAEKIVAGLQSSAAKF
jgi:beta-phosphoglucomutase-like phosphatase (HAD superfamily)